MVQCRAIWRPENPARTGIAIVSSFHTALDADVRSRPRLPQPYRTRCDEVRFRPPMRRPYRDASRSARAWPRYWTAVVGHRPKVSPRRRSRRLGPKPANRPTTKPLRSSDPRSSEGRMNIVGSCVPGGSRPIVPSPIVTSTKVASGFRLMVSNRNSPCGRRTRVLRRPPLPRLDVLEDVDADDDVERRRAKRECLARRHQIVDRERVGTCMVSRRLDCRCGGIDAGHPRSARRHGFRHEAAAAAEVEHALAPPRADDRIEGRKTRRHHPAQRPQPARVVAPPVRGRPVDR